MTTKLNNKGMTLMELLVSVLLISVIMIFMYKLISDVRTSKRENDKIMDNIIKISEIEVDTVNEFVSELSYEKGEIDLIETWQDIWYNKNDYETGHFIRLDFYKSDSTKLQYAIGIVNSDIKKNPFEIQMRKVIDNSWVILKKWTLSEDVKDIKINEDCLYNGNYLNCQIALDLLDQKKEVIYTINYPLYFYTKAFKTDRYKLPYSHKYEYYARHCIIKSDAPDKNNNCINCPVNNALFRRFTTTEYNYEKTYGDKVNKVTMTDQVLNSDLLESFGLPLWTPMQSIKSLYFQNRCEIK